jgi:uroporphyrinogen III methyltransferase / synthase
MASSTKPAADALSGVRVLVPRAQSQAEALSRRIRAAGGRPIEAPVLLIEPGDEAGLARCVQDLAAGRFQGVCFTSPNGVRGVADALAAAGLDGRAVRRAKLVACVGPGTARALQQWLDLRPDLVPAVATTLALGDAVPRGSGRVLLPRADIASPVLPDLLRDKGYDPVEVVAYRTGRPEALPDTVLTDLRDGRIDLVAVASPSTARNLVALAGDGLDHVGIVSIGPVTTAACEALGLPVAVEAAPHTIEGLVGALARAAHRP